MLLAPHTPHDVVKLGYTYCLEYEAEGPKKRYYEQLASLVLLVVHKFEPAVPCKCAMLLNEIVHDRNQVSLLRTVVDFIG